MSDEKFGYMDAVDFDHELGEASGGNVVYASLNDILKCQECSDECGVYKVKITKVEVAHSGASKLTGMNLTEWEAYEKSDEYLKHLEEKVNKAERVSALYKKLIEKTKAKQ